MPSTAPTTAPSTVPTTCPAAPLFAYRRASLELAGVVGGVMLVAAIVCAAVGATRILPLAAISGALYLGVALLALLVTWSRSRAGLVPLVRAFMFSQFLRLFLGTAVLLALVGGLGFDLRAAFGWVLGWYWLLLAAEVLQLKRSVTRSLVDTGIGAARTVVSENRAP